MKRVTIRVPATTANLGPGFDAFGCALSLYTDVTFEETVTLKAELPTEDFLMQTDYYYLFDDESGEYGKVIGGSVRAPLDPESIHGGFYFYAQHMVQTVIFPGALDGDEILGIGHHTDGTLVSAGIGANGAKIALGEILAHGAGMDGPLGLHDGIRKFLRCFLRKTKHMKCQSLGSFTADTGQSCKLIRQILQCSGKILHNASLEQTAQIQAAGQTGHIVGSIGFSGTHSLIDCSNHHILQHLLRILLPLFERV